MLTALKSVAAVGLATATLTLATAASASAHCGSCGEGEGSQSHDSENIVQTAAGNESFSTLVKAVKAAGLAETLRGDGPFTVFAPTNSAFDKLSESTLKALMEPGNRSMLRDILKFHVVPGKVMATDVTELNGVNTKDGASLKTVAGSKASVKLHDGNVIVSGSKVTKTDIEASNGVIHVLDSVMLPGQNDIVDTAASNTYLGTLTKAIKAAGLVETFQGEGPYTVFAPIDSAFSNLREDTLASLLEPANKQKLHSLLTYHVISGNVMAEDVMGLQAINSDGGASVKTVEGSSLSLKVSDGSVMVDGAKLLMTDIKTENGVVHVIDSVLMPGQH